MLSIVKSLFIAIAASGGDATAAMYPPGFIPPPPAPALGRGGGGQREEIGRHLAQHKNRGLKKQKNDDLPSTCSTETSEPHLTTSETSPSTSTAEVAAAPPQKRPRLEVEVPPPEEVEVEVIPTQVDLLDMTVEIV
ncbi:unnamed protein product, partial [Timema podura]|nr:unnamed protein product [Timema podura]